MADEAIVDDDTQLAVEEPVQEPETVEPEQPDAEALKAELERVQAEKDLQHKRATKAEAELKKLKTSPTNNPDSDERFERLELKTEGYKSDEVDVLMQNGGRKALDNPIIMAGIEAMRKQAKSKDATPSGTGKSTVYQKYTEQDLKKLPLEELEKIIPQ